MAITKVSQYKSTPTAVSDYQAQNAHLQAFINQLNGSVSVLSQSATTVVPTIKQGSYLSMGGTAYIVDTEDYTILGSLVAGLNYIALAVSGDNLTATWTNSLSGYSWNAIYNYYSDGTNALLPYVINYSSSNYYISQFNQNFRQPLNPDSDVEFNDIEANDIEANGTLTVDGAFKPTSSVTTFSKTLSPQASYVLPRGVYIFIGDDDIITLEIQAKFNSTWYQVGIDSTIFSDGTNVRIYNNSSNYTRTFNALVF